MRLVLLFLVWLAEITFAGSFKIASVYKLNRNYGLF